MNEWKHNNLSVLTFQDDLQFLRHSVFVCSCTCLSIPCLYHLSPVNSSLNNSAGVDLCEADRIKHLTHSPNYYSGASEYSFTKELRQI